jgi:hypothetical protein
MDVSGRLYLNVELFTAYHRISGVINTRNRLLMELLNDNTASLLELSKAFVSRLWAPGEIVASSSDIVVLRKNRILLCILTVPDKPLTERDVYSLFDKHHYKVVATIGNFEVTGLLETLARSDLAGLMAVAEGFMRIRKGQAMLTSAQPVVFEGEEIYVNRAHIDLLSTVKPG